ncbi:glycosyltransferase [Conexibacter sp. SYSU D00693]|uniref:glycosyltransferase n=1 Tax=Conexibacter sp. SYSU D00693 TaxID=2812560 RepID=UPI00196A295D|nr:glycosyltransferase [Conexibacter sp. SYSU D00693]
MTVRRTTRLAALGALAWSQAGYPLALAALRAATGPRRPRTAEPGDPPPRVTLVIAAYDEAQVIAAKVANALALDFPRDHLEVVVTDDGSSDGTPELAQRAGADRVIRNPRGGKVRAQDAAVRAATGDVVAFSDANALWEPDALAHLVAPFADPQVGETVGRVSFVNPDGGTNQEGLYWRYEMALRGLESDLESVTAGNGAIYAVRKDAYVEVDPVMGHDLRLPYELVRRGWRVVEAPHARATERMVPSVEGEAARKRRMMSHAWAIVLRGGLLDPRGWPPRYVLMMASHRWLRYAGPFLHVAAALTGAWRSHAALGALAAAGPRAGRAGLVARYYVLTQASIAQGLADHLRHGTQAGWEAAEGTR